MKIECNVCGSELNNRIYESVGSTSITSVCTLVDVPTIVYLCSQCDHVQTKEIPDEKAYYDETYNFLTESEDEDQIYLVENNKPIYRTEHQVSILTSKININGNMRILDYGCAKSSTMRELVNRNQDISPYLFDISDLYINFWEQFIKKGNWATYTIPSSWNNSFDLVTSFFSLEHISSLKSTLTNIKKVLNEDGMIYAVIPNTKTNPADMIVVDHPNHFTEYSLNKLFIDNGFIIEEIDEHSHRGAFIVIARKQMTIKKVNNKYTHHRNDILNIAEFWKTTAERVKEFEKNNATDKKAAIYGAGFYGSFLASCLDNVNLIDCFLDQNPFLSGKTLFNKPIIHPSKIPDDVDVLYVALNPKHSKSIIENVTSLNGLNLDYFYI